ncbi:MAG: hypothetical protein HN712_30555 [Gemmatimonadetes bacterium]|nr:hypothetical protein [Gemmatimonadota bacterium]MBT6147929.1 hypothetical protein [Gemmatimonadota bacterium]MBT7864687.1 hypothetical protein [Gemmatimonadota bacterium]
MSGPLPFYIALVMLAAVVVAKIVTMEMLRSHQRRLAYVHERREVVMADLRSVTRVRIRHDHRRRTLERKQHRTAVRINHAREKLELFDLEKDSRSAHFGLLTSHVVER